MRDSGTISLIPPTDKIFPTIVKSSKVALHPPVYTETKNKLEILSVGEKFLNVTDSRFLVSLIYMRMDKMKQDF